MLNVYIAFVASFFDTSSNTRVFLSSEIDTYSCPKLQILNNSNKIGDYIIEYIRKTTLVDTPETLSPTLISAKKTGLTELDLIYAIFLPIDTKIRTNAVSLCSYNIAIIDPYVRKALQYV